LKSCVNKIINRFESDKAFSGLQTNFSDFDDRTQGLQKGDLIIVAGLPTVGKTTFARTIAENVALNSQKNVAIFSLDMPADQMMMQMISSIGKIETHKLQSGYLNKEDWENLPMVISRLKETGIFVDDSEALSPLELRHKMQNLKSYHIKLIVIDYFQLMLTDTPTRNHSQEIRETLKELKALAK
jgi:replicative DNA helicase